jgi:hypothetical protein
MKPNAKAISSLSCTHHHHIHAQPAQVHSSKFRTLVHSNVLAPSHFKHISTVQARPCTQACFDARRGRLGAAGLATPGVIARGTAAALQQQQQENS